MPVMAGPEFLKRLRLEPGGEEPRVIYCSGETQVERIREALESGADEYIMKPFDAEIMIGKLATAGVA
jgi:two-component system, chemotaxis family, chemotaxis protein CheY